MGFFAARARGGSWLTIVLCKAALQLVSPPVCTGGGSFFPQCRTALFFAELYETLVCPFLQPAEVPLNSSLSVICPIPWVVNENVREYGPQYRPWAALVVVSGRMFCH